MEGRLRLLEHSLCDWIYSDPLRWTVSQSKVFQKFFPLLDNPNVSCIHVILMQIHQHDIFLITLMFFWRLNSNFLYKYVRHNKNTK